MATNSITALLTAMGAIYGANASLIALGYAVVKDHDFQGSGADLDRTIWMEIARSGQGTAFGYDTPWQVYEVEIVLTCPIVTGTRTLVQARDSIVDAVAIITGLTIGSGWSLEYDPAEYSGQIAVNGETLYAARITARTHQA